MIADVCTNDYEPLNDEVLRNEWSFRGQVSTDACNWGIQTDPSNYIGITDYWVHSDALLRGGTDFWLDTIYVQGNALKYPSVRTNADIYYLRRACKNILYTEANAYVIPSSKTWIELSVENAVKNVLG